MAREIDLDQQLSEEDREYLLARGRDNLVLENDAKFGDKDAQNRLSYVPGTEVDRAEGVPATPNADPTVVMGGGATDPEADDGLDDSDEEDADEPTGSTGEGAAETSQVDEDDYDEWSKAELEAEAKNRGLSGSGSKSELASRLREDDQSDDDD